MSEPDFETIELMRGIAGGLDKVLNGDRDPKPNGFVLLVFPEDGEHGARTNYISNCPRSDVIAAMKEVLARFEGQPLTPGSA